MNNTPFHMDKLCEITDVNCWKGEFEKNMNCDKNDTECWKTLTPNLPCEMGDVDCWKKEYPDMPCELHDKDCFKELIPTNEMPCKVDDKECWDTYRGKSTNEGPSQLLSESKQAKKEQQPQNQQDPYYIYGFGII